MKIVDQHNVELFVVVDALEEPLSVRRILRPVNV